jgi:phage-related baseplate assembly protein
VTSTEDLTAPDVEAVLDLARRDGLAWWACPKAGRLGTDLNRDSLAARLSERGVRAVRQIPVDDTRSALRFRPAGCAALAALPRRATSTAKHRPTIR